MQVRKIGVTPYTTNLNRNRDVKFKGELAKMGTVVGAAYGTTYIAGGAVAAGMDAAGAAAGTALGVFASSMLPFVLGAAGVVALLGGGCWLAEKIMDGRERKAKNTNN